MILALRSSNAQSVFLDIVNFISFCTVCMYVCVIYLFQWGPQEKRLKGATWLRQIKVGIGFDRPL